MPTERKNICPTLILLVETKKYWPKELGVNLFKKDKSDEV